MYNAQIEGSLNPPRSPSQILSSGRYDDVVVWKGDYSRVGPKKRALFFKTDLKDHPATAYLILSTEEVEQEVRGLMVSVAMFGLLFVAAGIALSVWLAGLITNPINILVRDMDIVSRGDLNHEARPHSSDEIGLLATAFNRMTRNLKEAQERQREADRINSELNMAKEIAASLLPTKIPSMPGYDIFATYVSAKEVGGDYYDFIPVDRTHLAFVAADASGKGIGAALIMANARAALRMLCVGNLSAADVLSKTNAVVTRDIKRGTFITVFYALLDVPNRELTVSSAGHDPMIVYRAATGRCESYNPNCVAIGFDPGPIFDRNVKEEKVKLYKGDRVVLYTDGVVECMNENNEQWGFENLNAFVREHANMKSRDFVRALERALAGHQGSAEQHDDITIVTFRVE
ncbi:MAG: SpoIIE family protein phosphatase [Planctomycetota bacterium]|nr:SpoIIE family protein phosphatase [Planctomycetota bacterium]